MNINNSVSIITNITILILPLILVNIKNIETNEIDKNDILYHCVGLKQSQMEICNQIQLEDDFIENDDYCNIQDCRIGCCKVIKSCFKTNFFTNNRIECVSNKLQEDYGTCCDVKKSKLNKTRVLYMSGAFGIAVASTGLFLLSFSKSDSLEKYESTDYEEDDPLTDIHDKSPYFKVKEVVATDQNDVFWAD